MKTTRLPQPQMRRIAINRLITDRRYQRDLILARVKRIADDLDLDALGVFTVSERSDGALVIVDGQHRHAAVMSHDMGEWEVEARVYSGISIEQEAALYRQLNDTRRITAWDDFKAGLEARDPECLEIRRIANEAGFKITNQSSDGQVCCIHALRTIYRRKGGADALLKSLQDSRAAWGTIAAAAEGDILLGLSILHSTYNGELDRPALIKKLSKFNGGPSGLLGSARGLRELKTAPVSRLVAMVAVELYNRGRRSGQLADL